MQVTSILLSYYFLATQVIATYNATCWKMRKRHQWSAGVPRSAKAPKVCFSISPDLLLLAGSGGFVCVGGWGGSAGKGHVGQ